MCLNVVSVSLREEQQMNVISWNAWSRTTTTPTDPGNTPTGTWLWRERASIRVVLKPARARRPSCFCPWQPSADQPEMRLTDHWRRCASNQPDTMRLMSSSRRLKVTWIARSRFKVQIFYPCLENTSWKRFPLAFISRNHFQTDVLGEHYRVYLSVFGHPGDISKILRRDSSIQNPTDPSQIQLSKIHNYSTAFPQ